MKSSDRIPSSEFGRGRWTQALGRQFEHVLAQSPFVFHLCACGSAASGSCEPSRFASRPSGFDPSRKSCRAPRRGHSGKVPAVMRHAGVAITAPFPGALLTGLVAALGPACRLRRRLLSFAGRPMTLEWSFRGSTSAAPGEWMVGLEAELNLRDLGMRGDIIKTMHRVFTERGEARGGADFVIEGGLPTSQIVGRLVDRGLHDELTGEAYAVIDGTDGRAHHVRFRGIEAFEHAPPAGGIAEVRRFAQAGDPRPTVVLASRSDLDLGEQISAKGATWLDHRLVERDPLPLAMGGFGRETRDAMEARTEHLVQEGLARRQGQRIILQRDLLNTLRQGREQLRRFLAPGQGYQSSNVQMFH